ncbi:MAG TPA: amidohydrolase family protein [Candidatus Limnocylindria bacterium]
MGSPDVGRISRRRLLQAGALTPAAFLVACAESLVPTLSPTARPTVTLAPTATASPSLTPIPTPVPTPAPAAPVLYRGAALVDGRGAQAQRNVSLLVADGIVQWIRPIDGEESVAGAAVVDAAGATIVPGLVDAHAHLTGAGGLNWIERFGDPPATLAATGEENAALAWRAGVRWVRDLGAPIVTDPVDGRVRAASLGVRDRLRGRFGFPEIRAAGSWVSRAGTLSGRITAEARNADELLAVALQQLDDGADLVKLYLEGPDPSRTPWSIAETKRVVDAVHARGARVAAHAGRINDIRTGVEAGVDTIEHGTELDAYTARRMHDLGTILVSTLTVFHSWLSFANTTTAPFYAARSSINRVQGQLEGAQAGVRAARAAGVAIAAGSDSGGGSSRANHIGWEFEALIQAGFPPVEALAAVTWRGGEALAEPEAGVIREGGPARFFLVHGDPLSDPGAIWRVWRHV